MSHPFLNLKNKTDMSKHILYYKKSLMLIVLLTLTISSANAHAWWGLWKSSDELAPRRVLYAGEQDQYVRLTPQNSSIMTDGKIHGVRFWIHDKTAVTSAKIWLSTSYSKGTAPNIMSQEIDLSQLKDLVHDNEPNVIVFDEGYNAFANGNPYANLFVGLTLQLANTPDYYQLAGKGKGETHSNYLNGTDISGNGALPIQVLASSPQIKDRNIEAKEIRNLITIKNSNAETKAVLTNYSAETLNSIDYDFMIDGALQYSKHYNMPDNIDEIGLEFELPLSITTPSKTEKLDMAVRITKINGNAPSVDLQEAAGQIIVLDQQMTKRTIMEEFTGTWCQNCIRGMEGIKILSDKFGDRFIPIAVHGDERDPMMITQYYKSTFFRDKMKILGGYPSCTVDRRYDCDPYCGYNTTGTFLTDIIVAEALQQASVADINVEAHWADESQKEIEYNVFTRFGYTGNNDNYRLVLVLTADGLKGEGNYWRQSNGYNEYTGTEEVLMQYVGKGKYLVDMEYNHVAIEGIGIDGGIEGSIEMPFTSEQTQHFNYKMNVADNKLVQDPQQLHAVVMLMDCSNGTIVNAAMAKVADATGIATPSTTKQESQTIYDLQGRRITTPARHGIYIVNGKKIAM